MPEPIDVEGLVGEQQVDAEAGLGHADHLPHRGAAERVGSGADRGVARQLGALVGLDV